jgi:putative transposase
MTASALPAPTAGQSIVRAATGVGVVPHFIEAGKPTQNAHVEGFNGKFRDECLNAHWFTTRRDAQEIIEAWRREHNESSPHRALGERTPNEFANEVAASRDFIELQTAENSP